MLECGGLRRNSLEATSHADRYYESVRRTHTDIEKISRNTNFTFEQVSLIKQYIFFGTHVLVGSVGRFDPSYEMAESWRRLSSKNAKSIQQHDILLLYHELYEISLVCSGHSQPDAHAIAQRKYNYGLASNQFYLSQGR